MGHFIVSAAQLEAENWLEVFPFEENFAFQPIAKVCCMCQRGFGNNFIDSGCQDEPKVLLKLESQTEGLEYSHTSG